MLYCTFPFAEHASYVIMQTLNHAPDYFVLCGEAYLDVREALTQAIVDGSADNFNQHVKVRVHHVKCLFQL